jgi:hypothetical protein
MQRQQEQQPSPKETDQKSLFEALFEDDDGPYDEEMMEDSFATLKDQDQGRHALYLPYPLTIHIKSNKMKQLPGLPMESQSSKRTTFLRRLTST